ncbi:MAG: pirin family protein [Spirochaetia bacterium]|jgi:redox-sensitive bicupin YhaK (pirin superfamily)|nr:pirin family protein [Spirochaetia bacterium]
MVKHIDSRKMGRGSHGWLESYHHFSFADYYNPRNIRFGVLRVVNDDTVQPQTGFDTHPHKDMEIVSYVVNGELTHQDSMGNQRTLSRGQVQYMSAGTGVTHSEYNLGGGELRFLQIWIFPDKKDYAPNYGDYRFAFEERLDRWLPIAASAENPRSAAPIRVHADINVCAAYISGEKPLALEVAKNRQAYLVLIEGLAGIQGSEGRLELSARDAAEITEENISIHARAAAHVLVLEMAKA